MYWISYWRAIMHAKWKAFICSKYIDKYIQNALCMLTIVKDNIGNQLAELKPKNI